MIDRKEHTSNYTVVDNGFLRDNRLSLKARGLLTIMLSLPDDWDFSIMGLAQFVGEGARGIRNTLKELKECGYVKIIKENITWHYEIHEEPQEVEDQELGYRYDDSRYIENRYVDNRYVEKRYIENRNIENRNVENRNVDSRYVENDIQLNTNIQNTNKQNTDIQNTKQPRERKRSLIDMVAEYTENEELRDSLKDFIDMRKSIKKPLTERALKMIFNKLDNMAKEKDSLKVLILNQSVLHCWQDVYEYKGEDKKEEQKKKPEVDNDPEFLAIFGL